VSVLEYSFEYLYERTLFTKHSSSSSVQETDTHRDLERQRFSNCFTSKAISTHV